ncbi:hypothetical protein [Pseudomonas sp. OIL-1]|uniref:hypothetical protein n=1 Tax=Pseudomonas sp. OIL-1 TaxID=2706126 RepID=UPI0013A71F91|nr:hypothetical protein [Pseudomonas sp. OIL-1]QIB52833.1 hypothetical protein G3M63_18340 [Pseudomonas sp. OIL-1]
MQSHYPVVSFEGLGVWWLARVWTKHPLSTYPLQLLAVVGWSTLHPVRQALDPDYRLAEYAEQLRIGILRIGKVSESLIIAQQAVEHTSPAMLFAEGPIFQKCLNITVNQPVFVNVVVA